MAGVTEQLVQWLWAAWDDSAAIVDNYGTYQAGIVDGGLPVVVSRPHITNLANKVLGPKLVRAGLSWEHFAVLARYITCGDSDYQVQQARDHPMQVRERIAGTTQRFHEASLRGI